eukprot:19332-Heterococcus_DN1.PRE.10
MLAAPTVSCTHPHMHLSITTLISLYTSAPVKAEEALYAQPLPDESLRVKGELLWLSAVVVRDGAAHCYPAVLPQAGVGCIEVHAANILHSVLSVRRSCKAHSYCQSTSIDIRPECTHKSIVTSYRLQYYNVISR